MFIIFHMNVILKFITSVCQSVLQRSLPDLLSLFYYILTKRVIMVYLTPITIINLYYFPRLTI